MAVTGYDPFSEEFQADPFVVYQWMRDEAPVYYNEKWNWWALSRWDDVRAAALDPDTFLSYEGIDLDATATDQGGAGFLPNVDNPRHDQVRGVVQPPLVPRRVAAYEGMVREVVVRLVDAFRDRGTVDVAQELAWPMPNEVFFDVFGLPKSDEAGRDNLQRWIHELKDRRPDEWDLTPVARAATDGINAYFIRLLNERRREPRQDLVSHIVQASIEGIPFADAEITPESEVMGLLRVLFLGGVESTAGLTASCFKLLAEHPDQRRLLLGDPSLIPAAVEEAVALVHAAPARRPHHLARGHPARRARSPRAGASCSSTAPRTGTSASSPTRTTSGSTAAPSGTSASARASTAVSARRWRGWSSRWRCRRHCPCSVSTSSPARRSATGPPPTCTSGTTCPSGSRRRRCPPDSPLLRPGAPAPRGAGAPSPGGGPGRVPTTRPRFAGPAMMVRHGTAERRGQGSGIPMVEQRYCPRCGAGYPERTVSCPSCGGALDGRAGSRVGLGGHNVIAWILSGVLVVGLVGVGALLVRLGTVPSTSTGAPGVTVSDLPPTGQVWFGATFDSTSFALAERSAHARVGSTIAAVAHLSRVVGSSGAHVLVDLNGTTMADNPLNLEGVGPADVVGWTFALPVAGTYRVTVADDRGTTLATGTVAGQ